MKTQIKKNYYC